MFCHCKTCDRFKLFFISPLRRRGLYYLTPVRQSVLPFVTITFVAFFSETTDHSHLKFGIQLQLGVLYRTYQFRSCRRTTSCLPTLEQIVVDPFFYHNLSWEVLQ